MKAITTKFLGPINTKDARIKAYDCDGNSIIIAYDPSLSNEEAYKKAAMALVNKMEWSWVEKCTIGGAIKNGYVFVYSSDVIQHFSKVA
jgi:hypothetical protein